MSRTHRQILVAAEGLLLILFSIPTPAHSLQENWVDQIAQRVQAEHEPISREYPAQLSSIRQALERGDTRAVQRGVTDLVRMVATKQNGLSDPSAQSLLLYISEVTPAEYLDETTKSRLHLIRQMAAFRAETVEVIPEDLSDGLTVTPQRAPWDAGKRISTVHPIIMLGAEILVLVALGVIVLLFFGAGGVGARRPF